MLRSILAASFAACLLPGGLAFSSSFTPMLRAGRQCGLTSVHRPPARELVGGLRMQKLTPEEQKEYEELLIRSQEATFDTMIKGALAGMDDPEDEEEEAAVAVAEPEFKGKGFNIPIEEIEEEDYEPEVWESYRASEEELAAMTEEDRFLYEANIVKERADQAFEDCEEALRAGNLKQARKLHKQAKKDYLACGMTAPGSLAGAYFAQAFDEQRSRLYPIPDVDPLTAYAKNKNPWDV